MVSLIQHANGSMFEIDPISEYCLTEEVPGGSILPPEWTTFIPYKETKVLNGIQSNTYESEVHVGKSTLTELYAVSENGIPLEWDINISTTNGSFYTKLAVMAFQSHIQADSDAYQAPSYCFTKDAAAASSTRAPAFSHFQSSMLRSGLPPFYSYAAHAKEAGADVHLLMLVH